MTAEDVPYGSEELHNSIKLDYFALVGIIHLGYNR